MYTSLTGRFSNNVNIVLTDLCINNVDAISAFDEEQWCISKICLFA